MNLYYIHGSGNVSPTKRKPIMKTLSLTDTDRLNCSITFNVNRFEVYHASGWLMLSAYDKANLKEQLSANGIKGALFDGIAQRFYLAG